MAVSTVVKRIAEGLCVVLMAAVAITVWRVRAPGGRPPAPNQWTPVDGEPGPRPREVRDAHESRA